MNMSPIFRQKIRALRDSPWSNKYLSNYVFVAIPKTGSSSVRKIIGRHKPYTEHMSAAQILQIIGRRRWEKRFTFSFVRNPFARCVSMFRHFGPGQIHSSPTFFRDWVRAYFHKELYPYRTSPILCARWNQVHYLAGDGRGGGGA